MLRRRTPLFLAIAIAIVAGTAAATTADLLTAAPREATAGVARTTERPTDAIGDRPASSVDAVLSERVERATEAVRGEPRHPSRQQRPSLVAVATAVATLAVTALMLLLARRRGGRTPVRVGRIVPARAPPPFSTCS